MSGKNLMPPVPGGRGLRRKTLGLSTPRTAGETVYEVEFVDKNGRTYAEIAINEDKLLVLHYEPILA